MSISQISVEEIQRDLRAFLRKLETGESLVILKSNKPIAEVTPMKYHPSKLRPYGLCEGEFTVPENFNDPLPGDLINEFEGK